MEAKFGNLRGVVSVLASMHPAWQSVTMAASSEPLRQKRLRHRKKMMQNNQSSILYSGTVL